MRLGRRIGLGAVAIALALPASAAATTYFAAPTASGTGDCSTSANACTIYSGVLTATTASDELLLADGSYDLTGSGILVIDNPITIRPQVPGTRPVLTSTNGTRVSVNDPATLMDLRIDVSGLNLAGQRAIDFLVAGSTGLRLEIRGTGTASVGVHLADGALLSDSTVRSSSANTALITTGGTGAPSATLRNVTAFTSALGTEALVSEGQAGNPQIVNVHNSILRGNAGFDIAASAPGATVDINVDHSNFATVAQDPGNADVVDMGGNQTATPLLANPATGDFTQLAGSPTIDAGAAVGGLGPLDFSGGARLLGTAPDIGADEFPSPAAAAVPPPQPNPASPAATKKCKKKKRKKSRGAVAAKKCKKKKKKK